MNSKWVIRPLTEWKAGLLECLPVALRRRLAPPSEPYILEITEANGVLYRNLEGGSRELGSISAQNQQLDPAMATLLRSREDPFILRVPESWVLLKKISLPNAAKENLRQVIELTLKEFTRMKTEGVSKIELERAKDNLKGRLVLGLETSSSRMSYLARSEFYYGRVISIDEIFKKVDSVTQEDIIRLSQESFLDKYLNLTIIGDIKKPPLEKLSC